jgi:predicted glycoside hydrolase/deacetylase ChbG (UPF0249 family)
MTLILCADDFGLYSGVSQAIIQLVRKERLTAVSCMTNGLDFTKSAPELLALNDKVQLGLHFNLTEGHFLSNSSKSCFSLNELLVKTHLRLLDKQLIMQELHAQLDAFVETMGEMPAFIDGHQHVHQFPGIREVVLEVYKQRFLAREAYIRSTFPMINLKPYQFKMHVIALTGGRALQSALTDLKIPHNAFFSGVYDFDIDANYRTLFRQWLALIPPNTLMMCHPGEGNMPGDAIALARVNEFKYLLSDEFVADCREYGVELGSNKAIP